MLYFVIFAAFCQLLGAIMYICWIATSSYPRERRVSMGSDVAGFLLSFAFLVWAILAILWG